VGVEGLQFQVLGADVPAADILSQGKFYDFVQIHAILRGKKKASADAQMLLFYSGDYV
jgi:hypothetical protein